MSTKLPAVLLLTIILMASVAVSTIPVSNALIQRNFNYLNDQQITVRTGDTKVCGDHLCAPGEWDKLQASLANAQMGNNTGTTTSMPAHMSVGNYPAPSTMPPSPTTMPPIASPTTSSCPAMLSMSSMNGMSNMTPIMQNATTADYGLVLEVGPQANMLMMCQVTSSTTSGEVMVAGQMNPTNTTGNTYHLELHIYNIKTGATQVVPINSVGITLVSSSGAKTVVPISEMFGIRQGPVDFHYGNNIQMTAGNYTVNVSVGNENASFNITIPGAMSSGTPMK